MTTYEKMQNTIANQLGFNNNQIKMESRFREDLNADSLDDVELIMAFEEDFDIQIEDEECDKIVTVADALALLDSKLAQTPND